MNYKNGRIANHGDSIVAPGGAVGTLQLIHTTLEAVPKTIMERNSSGQSPTAIEVGECYHAQDAFTAVDSIAALQTANAEYVNNLTTTHAEITRLEDAVKALTPKV